MAGLVQGIFRPQHPEKYKGNPHNIIYRSSYELKFMMQIDRDPNITRWSSEEMVVRYTSPLDGRRHRYFIDFYVEKQVDGKTIKLLIEIKPAYQLVAPVKKPRKKQTTFLREVATYVTNQAKWEAATKYAEANGYLFKVYTEKELGIPQRG